MKIKNVVKVMNFYSLLRVDASKRRADKLIRNELEVREFCDNILNNKNLILDKRTINMNPKGKELNIYIANDMGFCGNFNSNIKSLLIQDSNNDKIVIGKKIMKSDNYENVILSTTKEDYFLQSEKIFNFLYNSISSKKYKEVNLIYNHYYNISKIERIKKKILPLKNEVKSSDDFVVEGDINKILLNIITLYLVYEIRVAVENSYASENIMRQMTTKESLKKIDEIEDEKRREQRVEENAKVLKEQLENINKMKLIDDDRRL